MKNKKEFGAGIHSFFMNPSYIIRKLVYKKIKKNANFITGKVLDFGCGEKPYQELFLYETYIGLDFQKTGHDNTENKIDVYWDGETIPFEDGYFDSFLSTEVFEHIFNLDEILIEIHRVLKKDGYGIITIPFMIGEHEIPYDFARYTFFGIKDILEKNNFTIVSHKRLGNYYLTLLQLHRWHIAEFIYTIKNKYLRFSLNLLIGLPSQIIINLLSSFNFSNNQIVYLNNFILVQKK